MPCGKKPLVKSWDKPRQIKVIKPSRYQQNEASVKVHWKNVIKELELSYQDEQFWDSQCETVRGLVGPVIFERLTKIFNLSPEVLQYSPPSEGSSLVASEQFYLMRTSGGNAVVGPTYSMSDCESSVDEEETGEEETESQWTISSMSPSESKRASRSKSFTARSSKSINMSKSPRPKSFSKILSKATVTRSYTSKMTSKTRTMAYTESSPDVSAHSDDDVKVHPKSLKARYRTVHKRTRNPYFEMLYCNDSETDMIKWNSKYKQKTFEVSASDEFSKKAELLTKKIAFDFFEWWAALGNVEFKSEIKRPEDVEDLFQVWFDENASRGLMLDPKILPCVLQTIANYVGVSQASCPSVLKRQIAYDIKAETSPAHTVAFGTCLPLKMKHIPPQNSTKEMWHCVKIPQDLRSMACVWEDIQHLTSTKAFKKWLQQRPHMPMPQCLRTLNVPGEKKQLFVVPSDFVVKDRSGVDGSPGQDLAIPISEFTLEIKEVLSKLLNE